MATENGNLKYLSVRKGQASFRFRGTTFYVLESSLGEAGFNACVASLLLAWQTKEKVEVSYELVGRNQNRHVESVTLGDAP